MVTSNLQCDRSRVGNNISEMKDYILVFRDTEIGRSDWSTIL